LYVLSFTVFAPLHYCPIAILVYSHVQMLINACGQYSSVKVWLHCNRTFLGVFCKHTGFHFARTF